MNKLTCVVVGGGYAGINAVDTICKTLGKRMNGKDVRVVLIDKQPHHLRKVLLFKPAAGENEIAVPLTQLVPADVQIVQGEVAALDEKGRKIVYVDRAGAQQELGYDLLVLALGSVVRRPEPGQGGIALQSIEAATAIRHAWRENMRKAVQEKRTDERRRLLTLAVAGAGISGIETSAELAHAMREEAKQLGLDPKLVTIYLINAKNTLFPDGPPKMGRKLERALEAGGVTVLHGQKVMHAQEGKLDLSGGRTLPAGVCVWTLGLRPNPCLGSLGLPLTNQGQIVVDASYRVAGMSGVYSIGDCARIVDPQNGLADQMTCKEATAQAARLAKVIRADLKGKPAPRHKRFMDFFCVGLGPEQGIVWTRQCGIDIILTGKLGWKLRDMTWKMASLLK